MKGCNKTLGKSAMGPVPPVKSIDNGSFSIQHTDCRLLPQPISHSVSFTSKIGETSFHLFLSLHKLKSGLG